MSLKWDTLQAEFQFKSVINAKPFPCLNYSFEPTRDGSAVKDDQMIVLDSLRKFSTAHQTKSSKEIKLIIGVEKVFAEGNQQIKCIEQVSEATKSRHLP